MPSPRKLMKTASADCDQQSLFEPTISTSVCNCWVKAHYMRSLLKPQQYNPSLLWPWWTEAKQDQEIFLLCFGALFLHISISSWMGRYNIIQSSTNFSWCGLESEGEWNRWQRACERFSEFWASRKQLTALSCIPEGPDHKQAQQIRICPTLLFNKFAFYMGNKNLDQIL